MRLRSEVKGSMRSTMLSLRYDVVRARGTEEDCRCRWIEDDNIKTSFMDSIDVLLFLCERVKRCYRIRLLFHLRARFSNVHANELRLPSTLQYNLHCAPSLLPISPN